MISIRLRQLRDEKKMTQQEVADSLDVDRTTYTKYESGKSTPDANMLQKIAAFYDVSVDYILGRTNVRNSNNTDEDFPEDVIVLMRSVSKLTDKQKEIVKRLVQEFINED